MKSSETLLIKDAVFYAYHGATQPQINQGQRFIIDAEVQQDMSHACQCDSMDGQLDCQELYEILQEMTTQHRYNLMQVLALAIIDEIKKRHPQVQRITIGARKASCVMYSDCKNKIGGGGQIEDRIGVRLTRVFA